MEQFFNLFIRAAFVENLALTFFLGMCTFLAVSKQVETAIGLGLAVIAVQTITVPVNHLIYQYLLRDGAMATLEPGPGRSVRVVFDQPVRALAPGQAAVFYDGECGESVLGGGWIAGSLD